ncbi:MAG: peptidoglycan DD-metalloendopeptidase family protein [Candidatus Staskawiczbacteria bacterium]|nr:peptidoglycan DD-metalloendopeptidase family protein [Candidatus Staskawiczbacteria bacterium]
MTGFSKKSGRKKLKRLLGNPFLYFGLTAVFLFGAIYSEANSLSVFSSQPVFLNSFLNNSSITSKDNLFFSRAGLQAIETPDLKIIQDNAIAGISTPRILSPKVLGDIFGASPSDIIEYSVQPGDTLETIAKNHNITLNTLLWANELTSSSKIKVGQTLVILPVSGVLHIVKDGDTIGEISRKYKAKSDNILAFNSLTSEGDIFIGDILLVPDGVMPKSSSLAHMETAVANNFFILPTEGKITQGIHYFNAVDVANKCGTPIYAAASGQVQRVKYGYNFGGGNYVTILHSGGISTYYGHLMTIFVKPGDAVTVGDRVALIGGQPGMPGAGKSTGCHLHFGVVGAKNPLLKYGLGDRISLK